MGCANKSQREFSLPINFQLARIASRDVMVISVAKIPRIIGVISDTHGLFRPEAKAALAGSDLIIHAGDVGKLEILTELKTIAPLFVVRGNVDNVGAADQFPTPDIPYFSGSTIYILHDLNELDLDPDAAGFQAVITGHTHRAHEY